MKAKTIIKTASSNPVLGILSILAILALTNCSGDDGGEPAASDPSSSSDAGSSLSSSSGGVADTPSSSDGSSSSSVEGEPSSSGANESSSSALEADASSSSEAEDSSSSSVDEESSSSEGGIERGTLSYEGQTYGTVKIGSQTWLAENLNYAAEGSKCYGDDDANCAEYGRLYDWSTAMGFDAACNSNSVGGDDCDETIGTKHRGICPAGWHIPSGADWDALMSFIHEDNGLASFTSGSSSYAGKHLKATEGWTSYSGIENLDTYGFAALPGGFGTSDGFFSYAGFSGYWWSASEDDADYAYDRYMYYDDEDASWSNYNKTSLFSVRCLQD